MNQKNSLGLNFCFKEEDNPIGLFKEWFNEAIKSEINEKKYSRVNVLELKKKIIGYIFQRKIYDESYCIVTNRTWYSCYGLW